MWQHLKSEYNSGNYISQMFSAGCYKIMHGQKIHSKRKIEEWILM